MLKDVKVEFNNGTVKVFDNLVEADKYAKKNDLKTKRITGGTKK
jgi:hypothetical protein